MALRRGTPVSLCYVYYNVRQAQALTGGSLAGSNAIDQNLIGGSLAGNIDID